LKIKELVKVDSKGRITIPLSVREAFDIREGMNLLVVADTDEKSITLSPVPEKAKLVEIIVRVEDRPGVLATISRSLADNGVDIVFIKCGVIRRGELGECTIIADVANSIIEDVEGLRNILLKLEPVKNVETRFVSGR